MVSCWTSKIELIHCHNAPVCSNAVSLSDLHLSLCSLHFLVGAPSLLDSASMYCLRTLSWPLLLLLLLQSSQSSAQSTKSATTTAASSSAVPPSCIQSRSPTASSAAAIQSSIASDNTLSKACDAPTQQWVSVSSTTQIFYALDSSYFFNISLPAGVTSAPPSQDCTNNFNTILSSCVMSRNFWGGWIVSNGMNYSSM